MSTAVSADKRVLIEAAVPLVETVTLGEIRAAFQLTEESDPIPGLNEVTSTTHAAPSQEGCASDVGCTIPFFQAPGVLRGSRAVQPESQTPQAYVHDVIGHGVLGMCHIDGTLIGGPANSLMSGGPGVFSGQIAGTLTVLDQRALQAVYRSALNPGATLSDFRLEGLVNP